MLIVEIEHLESYLRCIELSCECFELRPLAKRRDRKDRCELARNWFPPLRLALEFESRTLWTTCTRPCDEKQANWVLTRLYFVLKHSILLILGSGPGGEPKDEKNIQSNQNFKKNWIILVVNNIFYINNDIKSIKYINMYFYLQTEMYKTQFIIKQNQWQYKIKKW